VLEVTTNLNRPIQWAPIGSGITQYNAPLDPTSTNRFYRLRR